MRQSCDSASFFSLVTAHLLGAGLGHSALKRDQRAGGPAGRGLPGLPDSELPPCQAVL